MDRTIGQIQTILANAGARVINVEYEHAGPVAISLSIEVQGRYVSFLQPSRWQGIMAIMERDDQVPGRLKTEQQARRDVTKHHSLSPLLSDPAGRSALSSRYGEDTAIRAGRQGRLRMVRGQRTWEAVRSWRQRPACRQRAGEARRGARPQSVARRPFAPPKGAGEDNGRVDDKHIKNLD